MTFSSRMYAPPRTSATGPGGRAPTLARVLVPVCLMVLFVYIGGSLISLATLNSSLMDQSAMSTHVASSLLMQAGAFVGVLAGMLTGDRHAARHALWVGLTIVVAAGVANLVSPTLPMVVATPGLIGMLMLCTTLVAMGYALRSVALRQSYLVIAAIYGMRFMGWLATRLVRSVADSVGLDSPVVTLVIGVIFAGLAIAAALALVTPGTEQAAQNHEEPAGARPPAGVATLAVLLLGLFDGFSSVRYLVAFFPANVLLRAPELSPAARDLLRLADGALPSIVCFAVLIVAAWRWWRPSVLALLGIGVACVGAAAHAAVPVPDLVDAPASHLGLHLGGAYLLRLGRHAIYGAAFWVLVRQLVPRARVVFWGGVAFLVNLVTEGVWTLAAYLMHKQWLGLSQDWYRQAFAGVGAAGMLVVGIALLVVLRRYQFLPLSPSRRGVVAR